MTIRADVFHSIPYLILLPFRVLFLNLYDIENHNSFATIERDHLASILHVLYFITFENDIAEQFICKSFDRTFNLCAGCSHLEESFPLHSSREEDTFGTTVPGALGWIRPVHPYSSSQKRGHFTMVHVNWVVGDHVDAFVDEG